MGIIFVQQNVTIENKKNNNKLRISYLCVTTILNYF